MSLYGHVLQCSILILSRGGVPALWGPEQGEMGLWKGGRETVELQPAQLILPKFKLYFRALVLEPDTSKTQGVLSEDQHLTAHLAEESALGGRM